MQQEFKLPDPPDRSAPAIIPDEPKPPKPMSVSGFAENALRDAFEQLKGIYQLIPTVAGEAVKIFKARKDLPNVKMEHVGEAFGENVLAMKDAILDPYKKHGVRVLYEKPVTAATDLLAIYGLTAKSAGMAGRMAGGVVRAKPVTMADKVVTLAKTIEELPATLARKGIDAGTLKLTGGKVDLAKRREFLHVKSEEMAQVPLKVKADMETVGKQIEALDDGEAALFHKWRVQGTTAQEMATSPKTAQALESWRKLIDEYQGHLKQRGLLDDASIAHVLEKKLAAEVFGKIDDATLAAARDAIAKAEVKPVYGPSLFDKKGWTIDDYVDEILNSQKRTGASVNFLEEYKGKAGSIADPRKYVPKHIASFRHVEGKLRFRDRLLQSPDLTGAPKGTKPMEGAPPPGDISKTYYQDQLRWDQASQKFTDPTIKRLLQLEFAHPQGPLRTFLRVYDRILDLFRKSATVLNPRWYIGNAVGDAVLGTLAGSEWRQAQKLAARGSLPPQIAAKFGPSGDVTGSGGYLERASEIGNSVDQATKAGIITKEVGRQIKETAVSAEASFETLENVLRSTQQFSDVQVQMQLLQESIARGSDKVRRVENLIAREVKKENAALQRMNEAYRSKNTALKEQIHREELMPLRQRIQNLETAKGAIVKDIADDMATNGALEAKIPGLREQNAIVRNAVERANAFLGDYLGMDGFEQGVMRRLIPFYAWSKAMTMLAFRLPFLSPVKSFLWHRYAKAMWTMAGDPEIPEYARGYVPLLGRENGDQIWVKLSSYSPFSGLRISQAFGLPVPAALNLSESSPLINVAFKGHGGKTIFDKGTMPHAGEDTVFIGDGSGYKITNGEIQKFIDQAPAISSVAHMFPIVQYLEELLLPFKVNKYGWHGFPEPTYNPDGSYKYPREWWERLAGMAGVGLQSRSRESMIRSKKIMERQALEAMKESFRKASPEDRPAIRDAIRDYLEKR